MEHLEPFIQHTRIAYFSMEIALRPEIKTYAGGLGVLAGDHLKSASDLGVPLVGVSLLYQQGYFRQYLNAAGWQQESYEDNDFRNLPLELERGAGGNPLTVRCGTTAGRWARRCGGRAPGGYRCSCWIPTSNATRRRIAISPISSTGAIANCG